MMRRIRIGFGMAALGCFVFASLAWGQAEDRSTWNRNVDDLTREASEISERAAQAMDELNQEKSELYRKLEVLRLIVAQRESELNEKRSRFDELETREREARERLGAQTRESGNIQAVLRMAARDLEALWQAGPVTALKPEQAAPLKRIREESGSVGMEDLRVLVDAVFEDMAATGQIEATVADYVDRSGTMNRAKAIRLGGIGIYYHHDDRYGLLMPVVGGGLVEPAGRPGWFDRRAIRQYFDGDGNKLPVDISGGAALERLEPGRSFRDWLRSGGLLIWPLLLIAMVGLVLFLERLIKLSRLRGDTDDIMGEFKVCVMAGDWSRARRVCDQHPEAPACRILAVGLENRFQSDDILENNLREAILKEQPALERFLPTLGLLAAIAPLLGLLGTVTGMIGTFQVITRFGSGDPQLMAGGISEALITTQVGLAVALPILLGHHFLDRRVDRIMEDMEEKGLAFMGSCRPDPGERP
jgi:biopolymer transport protein ExbB